jgi:predicted butyrate kinase (DUF1464 family)
MDGELAYLLGPFPKEVLFSGGATHIAGSPELTPDELGRRTDPRAADARAALVESLVRAVAGALSITPGPREILLSGRLARYEWLTSELAARLSGSAPVRRVQGLPAQAKEAAQGAALLADGLAGGERRGMVEALRLREASGTALDHIYVQGADRLREEIEA